jgi:hypothetical protein
MVQPSNDGPWPSPPRRPRPIELNVLLTEKTPEVRARYDEYADFYKPATPGERDLLSIAVGSNHQRDRIRATLTEIVNNDIRTAIFHYNNEQEDQVQHYRDLLESQPGVATVGLKRSAMGCRFLISRYERFHKLLRQEGCLFGNDKTELILYQGARATGDPACLHESVGAYLITLFCLIAQPEPKDEHVMELASQRYMPEALRDRQTEHWLGAPRLCREVLTKIVERELALLREREALLRTHYEEPARAGAEVRRQVLHSRDGMQLSRLQRMNEQQFIQAYQTFVRGRKESHKSGMLPGQAVDELHTEEAKSAVVPARADPAAESDEEQQAEADKAERTTVAAALAPGGANGIGASICQGDRLRYAVIQEHTIPPEDEAHLLDPDDLP